MAEKILFSVAGGIVGELSSLLRSEIELLWGAKNDLRKLERTMSRIKAILLDAEERQAHDNQVRDWLQKLEGVVYDADDLVDDFHTEALRRSVIPGNKLRKQVCIFFSSSNQLAFWIKIGHKIKEIRGALEEIRDENTFQLVERVEEDKLFSPKERETHSFVREEEVIGRDDEREEILKFLLHDDATKENVSTITIVGIGGLGKTTLAQYVFNNERVKKHFEPRLWVCVSDVFDLRIIASNIIKSANHGSLAQNPTMDELQNLLRKQIDGKRYFLVLDDVWNDDPLKWYDLKSLLMGGARGSRVLITTRSEKVAMITHSFDDKPFQLSGLEKDMSWSLFAKMAFRQQEDLKSPEIVELGKAILEKCKGVPLAIKTIGSMLYFKSPRIDWSLFKDNDLTRLTGKGDDILAALKLSYNHLPSYLKHCFAYCSLFPKDSEIYVPDLIKLWMAQGFIKADQGQCLEDVGYGYFLDLLWRSFFQEANEDDWGKIKSCKMHDLMHDLAISVSSTCSVLIDKDSINFGENLMHVSFNLSLDTTTFLRSVSPLLQHHYKLRKLFSFPTSLYSIKYSETDLAPANCMESCLKFKLLRALDLNKFSSMKKLPNSFGELKHLRYLDLSMFSEIQELPNSFTKLWNLQTLNLEGCMKLLSLPRDIHKMVSLRHFRLGGCRSLSHMPSRLGELTSLQTLDRFVIAGGDDSIKQLRPSSKNASIGKVGELCNLNNLREELWIENLRPDIEESKSANLKGKQHLRKLGLVYVWSTEDNFVEKYEKSLELLQPHPNLKALVVICYLGVGFASWVKSLVNLVALKLHNCRKCVYLPSLHVLPCLQQLELEELISLAYIDVDRNTMTTTTTSWSYDLQVFPSLKQLKILDCPKLTSMPIFPYLKSLHLYNTSSKPLQQTMTTMITMTHKEAELASASSDSGASSFQSLSNLVDMSIEKINDLQSLPQEAISNLSSLRSLKIERCTNLTSLPKSMGNLSSLQSLKIHRCTNLTSLPEAMGNLSSLQSFDIEDCTNLASFPEAMGNLSSLQSLEIQWCTNLTSLPEAMGNLSSLQTLHIQECTNLTSLPEAMGNLSSLQTLHIQDCTNLTLLPEAIGNLSSLQTLKILWCTNLTSLPKAIGNLSSLQNLHIKDCPKLTSLQEAMGNLSSLQSLKIRRCTNLTSLPEAMSNLSSLQSLHIQDCTNLTSFPKNMGNISSLQSLHIQGCPNLTSFPENMGNLSPLESEDELLRSLRSLRSFSIFAERFSDITFGEEMDANSSFGGNETLESLDA